MGAGVGRMLPRSPSTMAPWSRAWPQREVSGLPDRTETMKTGQTMRAAVYRGMRDLTIEDRPIPAPGPDEILVRVSAVGICGTDAHEYESGPHMFTSAPFIPGHEFAGHVVELGTAVTGFSIGQLVAAGAGISCGNCYWCRLGSTNLCETYETLGLQLPGGLAQYVVAPADICFEVGSTGLSSDVAAMTQPMSIAVHSLKRGRPKLGDMAIVIGAGGIGAFLVHALAVRDVTTVVVDLDLERLNIAKALGAELAVRPDDATDSLASLMGVGVPSVIYEATGSPTGLEFALSRAAPGTRVVVIGLQEGNHAVEFRNLALREIELIGTNAHAFAADFGEAVELLAARSGGWTDVAPVAIPLNDLVQGGLSPMIDGTGNRIKTLIDPWSETQRPTT